MFSIWVFFYFILLTSADAVQIKKKKNSSQFSHKLPKAEVFSACPPYFIKHQFNLALVSKTLT